MAAPSERRPFDLPQELHQLRKTVGDLLRENAGLKGKLRSAEGLIRENTIAPPDVKDLELQLIEARGEVAAQDHDANFGRSARGTVDQFRAALDQERALTQVQQDAYVRSETGRLKAEGEAKAAISDRDRMQEERDAALEQVKRTEVLRKLYEKDHQFYEHDHHEVIASIEAAREGERKALERVGELEGVHARNEQLTEENSMLQEANAQLGERVEVLEGQLEEAREHLQPTIDPEELAGLQADVARLKEVEGQRDAVREENVELRGRIHNLEKTVEHFKTIAGSLALQKGVKGIHLGSAILHVLPILGPRAFRNVAQERFGVARENGTGKK